jgi:predicted P-loop ATPase
MARQGARTTTRKRKADVLVIRDILIDDLTGLLADDTFRGETMLLRPIPRPRIEPPDTWEPRPFTDVDTTHMMEVLIEMKFDRGVTPANVNAAVNAEGARNHFSSARRWLLERPRWDGVVRLDRFYTEICGAREAEEGDDEDTVFRSVRYFAAIGRCTWISIVARIMLPGCQVDTVPVLEGLEGISKTKLLRMMAGKEEWFSDSFPSDLREKDAMQHLPGTSIIELAELEQLRSTKSFGAIKNFLTRKVDKYRRSYGRRDIVQPRQNIFIGTTNDSDYLPDVGGTRRFWPVKCGNAIDLTKLAEWKDQLYAEALVAYAKGEQWHLSQDLEEIAKDVRGSREVEDLWEVPIGVMIERIEREAKVSGEQFVAVTVNEAIMAVDASLVTSERRGAEMRAAKILRKQGFTKQSVRLKNGEIVKKWRKRLTT